MNRMTVAFSLALLALGLTLHAVHGATGGSLSAKAAVTLYVATTGSDTTGDGSEGNPFATIQHAINQTFNGDEVCVQPGTYTGTGNRDLNFFSRAITVRSCDDDPATCIIDCEGSDLDPHRGFVFQGLEDTTSVLRGFTIRGGYADDWGGGILFFWAPDSLASPLVENCVLTLNEAPQGAGFAAVNEAGPTIRDCMVTDNIGPGGEWCPQDYDGGFVTGASLVERCRFERNSAGVEISGEYMTGEANLNHCVFSENDNDGFSLSNSFGIARLDSCEANGNGGVGVHMDARGYKSNLPDFVNRFELTSYTLNSMVEGNVQGGIIGTSEYDYVVGCTVSNNGGPGIALSNHRVSHVEGCVVFGNEGVGIIQGVTIGDIFCLENTVYQNDLSGILFNFSDQGYVQSNLVYGNGVSGIDFSGVINDTLEVTGNTVADNTGHGVTWAAAGPHYIARNLIAFNGLNGLGYVTGDVPGLDNCDLFGNAEGDWVGTISDQLGTGGNISVDPRFCDLAGGDLTLRTDSPCISYNHPDGPGFGPIGALGLGCFTLAPHVVSVQDVDNDQGRQIRLTWNRSEYDALGSPYPITGYGIYRRQEETVVLGGENRYQDKLAGWDFLKTAHARGDEVYQVVAQTLCDSTVAAGMCLTTFMVSAITAQPLEFFDSQPDSGFSLDNLFPMTPAGVTVTYGDDRNELSWNHPGDPDVDHFFIHRYLVGSGSSEPASIVPVRGTTWTDTGFLPRESGWDFRYRIAAVDFSGNSSPLTEWDQVQVSGTDAGHHPGRFVLYANSPNPFNPLTSIRFDLPGRYPVDLRIFDLSGKLIRTVLDGTPLAGGTHDVSWNGRDSSGQRVAAGIYLYRLQAGGFSQTERMTLLK